MIPASRATSPRRYLEEVREHAQQGDVEWLTKAGKVYAAINAG